MEFSRLERAAVEAILSRPVDGMETARAQFAAASVVKRDYTGVGFYTTISVRSSVPPMPDSKELREALWVGAAGLPKSDPDGWVSFMLWTDVGYLACLEGCTVRDSWPDEDEIVDVGPCKLQKVQRTRSLDNGLMSDCENRRELWRANTSAKSLFMAGLFALVVIVLAVLLLIFIDGVV